MSPTTHPARVDTPMCCVSPGQPALDERSATDIATLLKALADPARLRIISMIASAGEACNCDFTEPLGLSQPTVSHHLKILTEAGVLNREKRGKWVYFTVDHDRMTQAATAVAPPPVQASDTRSSIDSSK